jgi:5-methylcytosine-specific restriction endonuclease McrA
MYTECEVHNDRVVYYIASNGVRHHLRQCQTCGVKTTGFIAKIKLMPVDLIATPPFDQAAHQEWEQRRNAYYTELAVQRAEAALAAYNVKRQAERDAWRARYDAYMVSPEWRSTRRAVLRRAHGRCHYCGRDNAIQAHHLTYARLGHERPEDLVAVCVPCHEQIHGRPMGTLGLAQRRGQRVH